MAQTKRKRRTKHRGNAAGVIVTRGRPASKQATSARTPRGSRAERTNRWTKRGTGKPTWANSVRRGALMALVLFAFTQITSVIGVFKPMPLRSSLLLAALAVVIYTPMVYGFDHLIYRMRIRRIIAKAKKREEQ